MPRFLCDIQMRFRDLDPMGHVNNAVFLSYCELARTQFYLQHAFKRKLHDIDLILARAEIDFVSAAGGALAWSSPVLVPSDDGAKVPNPTPAEFRKVREGPLEP